MLQHLVVLLLTLYTAGGILFKDDTGIKSLRDKTAEVLQNDARALDVSGVFDSKSFYILTKPYQVFDKIKKFCAEHKGYLVEINSEEEYLFLDNFLSSALANKWEILWVLTGVKYKTLNGPFTGDKHRKDTVFQGDGHWAPGQPDRDSYFMNWMNFWREFGETDWLLKDAGKGTQSNHKAALCEVSSNYL